MHQNDRPVGCAVWNICCCFIYSEGWISVGFWMAGDWRDFVYCIVRRARILDILSHLQKTKAPDELFHQKKCVREQYYLLLETIVL